MKTLQDKINETYKKVFGYTPQTERLEDIQKQFFKLMRNTGVKELKEATGDLLSTLIQLANESDWSVEELVENNLSKINNRKDQYRSLGRKKRIAILGGAFNPITKGHIELARFVLNASGYFDEVWLMPAYSHMYNKKMESPEDRMAMCELAALVDARIKVFDYELKNQMAGETFKLVKLLLNDTEYENYDFTLIMGQDNANTFHNWVNYEHLERMMKFIVVPRKGVERDPNVTWYLNKPHIYMNKECDIMEISSTQVREMLKERWSSDFPGIVKDELGKYVDENVIEYIKKNNLYV